MEAVFLRNLYNKMDWKRKRKFLEETMDDFAVELENNISKSRKNEDRMSLEYRELFSLFITTSPKINILSKVSDDGDIKFSVDRKDMGISFDDLVKYRDQVFSDFNANFIGELLVRENIDQFAKILVSLDKEAYPSIVNRYQHKKFGMEVVREKFTFKFHISLLQSILTEDFKRQIKLRLK